MADNKEYEIANLAVMRYESHCNGLLEDIKSALLEDSGVETLDELSKEYQKAQRQRDYWRGVIGRSKTPSTN